MKKHKKASAVLAVLLAASMLTALPTAVRAAQKEPLILGDANSDGKVDVEDATLVQRYAAEEVTFSVRQTVAATVVGETINVEDATAIQKYAAELPAEAAVGEPLDEGTDGILIKKDVAGGDFSGTTPLWFSTRYEDIPFVDIDFIIETLESFIGRKEDIVRSQSDDGALVTLTMKNSVTVTFDYAQKTIGFSDYVLFTTTGDGDVPDYMDGLSENANREHEFVKLLPQSRYVSANSFCLQTGYDTIPMLMQDGEIYIPLATMTDFFYPPDCPYRLTYNGTYLFQLAWADSLYDATGELTELGRTYFDTKKTGLSDALTRFNYYELCAAMDANYGLRESHRITDFDAYFCQTGLKQELLSGDAVRMDAAMQLLIDRYFADLHSMYISPSPYFDYLNHRALLDSSLYATGSYQRRMEAAEARAAMRLEKTGRYGAYLRVGDTAYITFDAFSFSMFPDSYYPEPELNKWTRGDTVCILYDAFKHLRNEDADVRNIVLDLSCNTGGAVPALLWLLDFVIGRSEIEISYPNTDTFQTFATAFDLNFDGVIDENDKSLRELGYNIAVMTSDCSFSCGNAAPCYLKYLDPDVLVLGQTSGGGAAMIGYGSTAAGTIFRYSSNRVFVTRQNGQLQTVDNGVRPDIYLSDARMYDREYVAQLVDSAFS